jgi:pentatricopeptide repeat protein
VGSTSHLHNTILQNDSCTCEYYLKHITSSALPQPLTNSTIYPKQRNLRTSKFTSQDNDENDSHFVLILEDIVRGNQSWKVALDGVLVVKLMKENKLLPKVRTRNALLNGLVRIRQFDLVLQWFDEFAIARIRPDVYMNWMCILTKV